MKVSKGAQLFKGIAAVTAGFFVISSMGTGIVSIVQKLITHWVQVVMKRLLIAMMQDLKVIIQQLKI